jgi:hypothetical protein
MNTLILTYDFSQAATRPLHRREALCAPLSFDPSSAVEQM